MQFRSLLAGAAALALIAMPAFAEDYVGGAVKTADIGGKEVFTDAKGMTLYTFDKDVAGSGKSTCNGPCAVKWPPAMAKDGDKPSGDFTVVTRDDGTKQWAYKGKPVYTWPEDQEPGDKYGDNYNKVWRIVK